MQYTDIYKEQTLGVGIQGRVALPGMEATPNTNERQVSHANQISACSLRGQTL